MRAPGFVRARDFFAKVEDRQVWTILSSNGDDEAVVLAIALADVLRLGGALRLEAPDREGGVGRFVGHRTSNLDLERFAVLSRDRDLCPAVVRCTRDDLGTRRDLGADD